MKRTLVSLAVSAMMLGTVFGASAARADQQVTWTGNGLDSLVLCVRGVSTPHLHWVLTPGGQPVDGTTAELFVNGYARADRQRLKRCTYAGIRVKGPGRLRHLNGHQRGEVLRCPDQHPFAHLGVLDFLPTNDQERLSGRKREGFALLERKPLPLQRAGIH